MSARIKREVRAIGLTGPKLGACLLLWSGVSGCAATGPRPSVRGVLAAAAPPSALQQQAPFVPKLSMPDPTKRDTLSLEQLLVYADQHGPAARVARIRSLRGEVELEAASVLLQNNPELALGGGARSVGPSTFFEAEASLQQTVEIAGERGLRIEAARRTRQTALAQMNETMWRLQLRLRKTFHELLLVRERVLAQEQVVAFAEELQQIATRRVEAGEDSPLALLITRADVARAKAVLLIAKQDELVERSKLAEAAGWPADRPLQVRGRLPAIQKTRAISELIQIARRSHPGLRTAAFVVGEAESRLRLERREAFPEPTFGIAYGREGDATQAPNVWLFTLAVPIPLWNRNQGERARARLALKTAQTERDALAERLGARILRAANDVNSAAARVQIYGLDVVPAVQRNLTLIRRAYDLGELDIQAVSQTRERVLDTQARAIDARATYYRALASLEVLVGRDLDPLAPKETSP